MSPLPVLRTQLAVLRLFISRLPGQLGVALLVAFAQFVSVFVFALLGAVALPALIGAVAAFGALGPFLVGVPLALLFIAFQMACCGVLWRNADAKLLSAKHGPLPVGALLASALYTTFVLAGGALIAAALLYAVPGRLENVGVPSTVAYGLIIAALVVLYVPLCLRLMLLSPLVAVDAYSVSSAWRLVLRTTAGKTVPLLCALLMQLLVVVPVYLLFTLAVNGGFAAALSPTVESVEQLEDGVALPVLGFGLVGWLLATAAVGALVSALWAALQIGVVRHFFGFGETAAHDHEHIVVHDPEVPTPLSGPFAPGATPAGAGAYFDPSTLVEDDPGDMHPQLPPVYQPPTPEPAPVPQYSQPLPPAPSEQPPAPVSAPAVVQPQWEPAPEPSPDENPFAGLGGDAPAPVTPPSDDDPFAALRTPGS